MIHRILLIPTKATDPDRLLLDCRRMRLTSSIGSQMEAAAVLQWADVDLTDWRGTQARVLLDLPPIPKSWGWLRTVVLLLGEIMDELGAALGGWRVVAVDRDGREVELG